MPDWRKRRSTWVIGSVALLLIVVALVLLSGEGITIRSEVAVMSGRLISEDRVELAVQSCNASPQVSSIVETQTDVTVTVTALITYLGSGGDDCLDLVEVRFHAPLGDRTIIDGKTGAAVQVSRGE